MLLDLDTVDWSDPEVADWLRGLAGDHPIRLRAGRRCGAAMPFLLDVAVGTPTGGRLTMPSAAMSSGSPTRPSEYSMTKTALVGLAKGPARDLGPRGIAVTTVHPGSTDTEMNPANADGADAERARDGATGETLSAIAEAAIAAWDAVVPPRSDSPH